MIFHVHMALKSRRICSCSPGAIVPAQSVSGSFCTAGCSWHTCNERGFVPTFVCWQKTSGEPQTAQALMRLSPEDNGTKGPAMERQRRS